MAAPDKIFRYGPEGSRWLYRTGIKNQHIPASNYSGKTLCRVQSELSNYFCRICIQISAANSKIGLWQILAGKTAILASWSTPEKRATRLTMAWPAFAHGGLPGSSRRRFFFRGAGRFPTPGRLNARAGSEPPSPDGEQPEVRSNCFLPDTVPQAFRLAECGSSGGNIWERKIDRELWLENRWKWGVFVE